MRPGGTQRIGGALVLCLVVGGAWADDDLFLWDGAGDAVARPTDSGADATLAPGHVLPDLISARLRGVRLDAPAPATAPEDGRTFDPPDVLEIKLKFDGLVNPPGPLGFTGPDYCATRYGPSPLYGFLEIDVDDDRDTGGELGGTALKRHLANVGRFGKLPPNSSSERAVKRPKDLDSDFDSTPHFERSGAEFALALCACSEVTVVYESGDMDGIFDAGERWVVSGRFFKRAEAFQEISGMGSAGLEGPSEDGLYDPVVELSFEHDQWDDKTTVEMSFPLTAEGAAFLLGGVVKMFDFQFGEENHYSMGEALFDLIFGASAPPLGTSDEVLTLAGEWADRDLELGPLEYLDPREWGVTALFGTASETQDNDPFVWTDTGFGELFGDVNADGSLTCSDAGLIRSVIQTGDGGPDDAGPASDGRVTISDFGPNFSLFDVTYDGEIDLDDIDEINPCLADLAEPYCVLDFSDVFAFLLCFGAQDPRVDFASPEGVFDFSDVIAFMVAFGQGCPP